MLLDETKVCIIQCQVLVVGVIVKTLKRQSGNIRTLKKIRVAYLSCPNPNLRVIPHLSSCSTRSNAQLAAIHPLKRLQTNIFSQKKLELRLDYDRDMRIKKDSN